MQAGAGRRRQRQRQERRRQQQQQQQQQLGGGGDGGNGSVRDDGATGGSVQGRGGGIPLREEADSPLHRRHPHGERAGPGRARRSPGSCFPSSPSPRPSAAHWRKECVATPRRGLLSVRGPLGWRSTRSESPSPQLLPSFATLFLHPFPFGDGAFAQSKLLGEGLKDLGRSGPIPYRNHLPSGRLNYLEMSQLHCYLSIF